MAIAVSLAAAACTPAETEPDGEEATEERPLGWDGRPAPDPYPEPQVRGRSFRIEGIPTVDRADFGPKRAYRNALAGEILQTGTYAITPDNQLCFHFEETPGNPCFALRPDPDVEGAFILERVGAETTARLIDIGPSDLDG